MTTREILTLQFGNYSNYIGTHWWNLQESNFSYDPENPSEVNNDVLYREGETSRSCSRNKLCTYTPRLLMVDLKGTLGYLNERGTLYEDFHAMQGDPVILWDEENVEITADEALLPKSSFIRSLNETQEGKSSNEGGRNEVEEEEEEENITSWVDYLVARFHPRTLNMINEYKHECAEQPFDIFNYGENLWRTKQFEDDFADGIRGYVEECHSTQGFQVLMDSHDGFGGLGAACVEHLRDEYGKSIICFPSIPGDDNNNEPSSNDLIKIINTALCWQKIAENCSLFSPLCCGDEGWPNAGKQRHFNYLNYKLERKYESSALLAIALDTVSLRYRLKIHGTSALSDLCADLNKLGRKAAATSLSLPFPMAVEKDLIDMLDDFEEGMMGGRRPLWSSITPNCEITEDRQMQSLSLRGVSEERLKRPIGSPGAKKQMGKPAYRCSTVHEMMTMYLAYKCHASATFLTNARAPLNIVEPFPKIFTNNLYENGNIAGWPVARDVKSVPVLAGLHSGGGLSNMYQTLYEQASRVKNIKRFHAFGDSGLEQDDFNECLNHLLDSKEAFEDHYV